MKIIRATLDTETVIKLEVMALGALVAETDPLRKQALRDVLAWLGDEAPGMRAKKLSNAVIIELIQGLHFEDPKLDAVRLDVIAILKVVPVPHPAKPGFRAKNLIGYGPVTVWPVMDAERVAKALVAAGCSATTMEGLAWFDGVDHWHGGSPDPYYDSQLHEDWPKVKAWIETMRRYKISTVLTVVNWNGRAQRNQPTSWYVGIIDWITQNIGVDRVILEPVSEPDSAKAHEWMALARQHWPGAIAQNGDGGRGNPSVSGEYVTWHCCDAPEGQMDSVGDQGGRPVIFNTDCGPQLGLDPDRAKRAVRKALDARKHFLVYSFARDISEVETVVAAMGQEIQRGAGAVEVIGGGTPPPPPLVDPLPSPNLLDGMNPSPWLDGTIGTINHDFELRLLRMVTGTSGRMIIADMDQIPSRLRATGFEARDTMLWYALSRSYAEWNWSVGAGDSESAFMGARREETKQCWQRYLDLVSRALRAAPSWSALLIANDGHDKLGHTLGEYSIRGIPDDVRGRVEQGGDAQDN